MSISHKPGIGFGLCRHRVRWSQLLSLKEIGFWSGCLRKVLCIRILQRNRTYRTYSDIRQEIDYEGLAQAMTEAKSYDLLSANWKPEEVGWESSPHSKARDPRGPVVKVLVQVQRPENQEHWCWNTREDGCSSSPAQATNKFTLLLPFCFIHVVNRLDDAQLPWWVPSLLSLPILMLISSRMLSQTH